MNPHELQTHEAFRVGFRMRVEDPRRYGPPTVSRADAERTAAALRLCGFDVVIQRARITDWTDAA